MTTSITTDRPPVLSFPSLHLGSFSSLSPDSFPGPSGSRPTTPPSSDEHHPNGLAARPETYAGPKEADARPNVGSLKPYTPDDPARTSPLRLPRTLAPPSLPPPAVSLPPIPALSPISPVALLPPKPPSPTFDAPPLPSSSALPAGQANPVSTSLGPGYRTPGRSRALGPSLTIHIPPPGAERAQGAVLKDSPSLPRRRTVVQASPAPSQASQARLSMALDDLPSPDASPNVPRRKESAEHILPTRTASMPAPAGELAPSPSKRSLPKPPAIRAQVPVVADSRAGLNAASSSRSLKPLEQPVQATRHQPTNSASTLPVIPGLMDAGPYPSSNSGINRTSGPSAKQKLPPPEEVCLECMMRDRDLADVSVTGPGVWDRQSDADWQDLKWREESLLKSMGSLNGSTLSRTLSESEESLSPGSTAHSTEETEAKRRMVAQKRRRELIRARRKEADMRIAKEIGWKGFKWEEGKAGEGLPTGFRGTAGGALSEEGIKGIMTKFPSASAHRYNALQTYLRHQFLLVLEVAALAEKLGGYPAPDDPVILDELPQGSGSRASSLAWDHSSYRSHVEVPSPVAPLVPRSVKPSPSSPADLSSIAVGRVKPLQIARPMTHFIPDREPAPIPSPARTPLVQSRRGSNAREASPYGFERTAKLQDEFDEEIWPPLSPAESGMRPFSFAVRAGAAAAREGSEGHGRRSIFGRWGGSVTSFFGGSQGGSGSMVDMQYVPPNGAAHLSLGLENDRRHNTSSHNVHGYPRAVSLASPAPGSFFSSRESKYEPAPEMPRMSKSISVSRLSQVYSTEDEPKKKGLKGLLKKMKPKSRKSKSALSTPQKPVFETYSPDPGTPLAPPPPMAYLVDRGERRDRSGSTSSMVSDNSRGGPNHNMRSVSAPLIDTSSGGSLSASPTSSRFNNAQRESYASRRQSGTLVEDEQPRGSFVEVLSGRPYAALEPSAFASIDDPRAHRQPHNKTNSSLSASSFVETPPPMAQPGYFPQPIVRSPGGAAPNRHKNLPPLPPLGNDSGPDAEYDYAQKECLAPPQASPRNPYQQPGPRYPDQPDFSRQSPSARTSFDLPPPRQSYEPLSHRSKPVEINARMAQSMYAQPASAASTGSFGRGWGPQGSPGYAPNGHRGYDASDSKSTRSRKGFKGFFGVSKAGRLA